MNEARDALLVLQIKGKTADTAEGTALLRKVNQRVQLVADELDVSFTEAVRRVRGY
jgi:hypothetical protein